MCVIEATSKTLPLLLTFQSASLPPPIFSSPPCCLPSLPHPIASCLLPPHLGVGQAQMFLLSYFLMSKSLSFIIFGLLYVLLACSISFFP